MTMEVTKLFLYPIKSLRGTAVDRAIVTKTGFLFDRSYSLMKSNDERTEANVMMVGKYPEMALFTTSIRFPNDEQLGEVTVTFSPAEGKARSLAIPLQPDTTGLDPVPVDLHHSETTAFIMDEDYCNWFSACFGFPVILAAIGENRRPALWPTSPDFQNAKSTSWFSAIAKNVPLLSNPIGEKQQLKFQDCAPFLILSQSSSDNISSRLPEGQEMDIRKFRGNIVVSGEEAWSEDYWGELYIAGSGCNSGDSTDNGIDEGVRLALQQNCVRCQSLNVDFTTGTYKNQVLKVMAKDRRVDRLQKWSSVFGRYGAPYPESIGGEIRVGAKVRVARRNTEITSFDWPL